MRPEDRYCHSLNFSLFVGGPCVIGAQKLGALCIHAGTVPSERLLAILRQFQATIIWTTPSYAWYLGETAVKEGIDPRKDLAVKRIFVAGEPGGSIPETRQRIEALWGAHVYDYYGLSDIFGSCAGMCEEKDGLHWAEDHILAEVLNPDTLEPVAPGERGEMVLTTLKKAARPLIRFRTGDIVSFTDEPCRCGRTSIRLQGVHGRLDDMLIIKGVNIFPSDVEAIVRLDRNLTGEYKLMVERVDHLDRLTVEAERVHGYNGTDEELAHELSRQLQAATGVARERQHPSARYAAARNPQGQARRRPPHWRLELARPPACRAGAEKRRANLSYTAKYQESAVAYEDPSCALCPSTVQACRQGEAAGRGPGFCPSKVDPGALGVAHALYEDRETREVALRSPPRVEAEGYCKWTRVEEVIRFAQRMGSRSSASRIASA